MKWHEYKTPYQEACVFEGTAMPESDWLDSRLELLKLGRYDLQIYSRCRSSLSWNELRRPYYNVYPSVASSLAKTTLEVPCKTVIDAMKFLPEHLSVRYQVGHELNVGNGAIGDFFVSRHDNTVLVDDLDSIPAAPSGRDSITLYVCDATVCPDTIYANGKTVISKPYTYYAMVLDSGKSVEDMVQAIQSRYTVPKIVNDLSMAALRTVMCLALLTSDSEVVSPVVLNAHREKFEKTGDPKYIEKAAKRGVVGWEVGRDIEVGPHYRRPHFGIRWTGKGAAEPKLVPVKGSIVHRKKIGDVPTGYLGQYA